MLNPIYARQTIPSPGHLGGEKGRHQQICDDLVHSGRGLFFRRSHRLYYLLDLQKVLRVVQSRANFSLGVGGGGGGSSNVTTWLVHVVYLVCTIVTGLPCIGQR